MLIVELMFLQMPIMSGPEVRLVTFIVLVWLPIHLELPPVTFLAALFVINTDISHLLVH